MNYLKLIDFSEGIKSSEIQHNFNVLDESLKIERLNTAGWGHLNGLEIEYVSPNPPTKKFILKIKEGKLVNTYGEIIPIKEQEIYLDFFDTEKIVERIRADRGSFSLSKVPYEINGYKIPSEDNLRDNILVSQNNNYIRIREIKNRYISLGQPVTGDVAVTYHKADSRYDLIVLNRDNKISVIKGTEVVSRSTFKTLEEYTPIALVSLNPFDLNNNIEEAVIDIVQMSRLAPRPIKINDENTIEFYGREFTGIREIYLIEPEEPEDGDIWYCSDSNQLKIWRKDHDVFSWLIINDSTFSTVHNVKLWNHNELPNNFQDFYFDEKIDMNFVPNTNSLQVFINNTPLMSDQFSEIVSNEEDFYRPLGVGFRLMKPLEVEKDSPVFVEARVSNVVLRKDRPTFLERNAAFIETKVHPIVSGIRNFETKSKYYKEEDQLSIYLNGKKLVNKVDYEEVPLRENEYIGTKTICKSFLIKRMLKQEDVLESVVNTNFYSYLHVENLLKEFSDKAKKNKADIEKLFIRLDNANEETEDLKEQIKNRIIQDSLINERIDNLDDYAKLIEQQQSIVNEELENKIDNAYSILSNKTSEEDVKNIIEENVDKSVVFSKTFFEEGINNIKNNGYLIDMRATGANISSRDYVRVVAFDGNYSIELNRNEDYTVIGASGSIKINSPSKIINATELCVSGIQFL